MASRNTTTVVEDYWNPERISDAADFLARVSFFGNVGILKDDAPIFGTKNQGQLYDALDIALSAGNYDAPTDNELRAEIVTAYHKARVLRKPMSALQTVAYNAQVAAGIAPDIARAYAMTL